ncbi:MAG TPA: nucleoside recognition domain-containing protein [Chthoniobacterales bacterium]
MLNLLWMLLLLSGVVVAGVSGRFDLLNQSVFASARAAVMDLALPLAGTMALWLGLMRLAEQAGLIALLAKVIRPLMKRLFPEIPPHDPALGSMMMAIAANMLGVSNAATPLGLRAMTDLSRLNPHPGTASNAMCMFLALNTAAIQLVPATAMNVLAINGGKTPTAIIPTTLLATTAATLAAVTAVKCLERLPWFAVPQPPATIPKGRTTENSGSAAPSMEPDLPKPAPLARWAGVLLGLLFLFFLGVFVTTLWSASSGAAMPFPANVFRALSPLVVPFLLTAFPLYAAGRGVSVYQEFVEGAKEGFQVAVRIVPFLVGMLVAIGVFRDSGALDLLRRGLAPLFTQLRAPVDLLPMILMRPLSGSGSIAVLGDLVKRFGPDHLLSYTAATIYGSAETTFYVVAVYFGSVSITRTRHAIPAGLLADLAGMAAAVLVCRALYGN